MHPFILMEKKGKAIIILSPDLKYFDCNLYTRKSRQNKKRHKERINNIIIVVFTSLSPQLALNNRENILKKIDITISELNPKYYLVANVCMNLHGEREASVPSGE